MSSKQRKKKLKKKRKNKIFTKIKDKTMNYFHKEKKEENNIDNSVNDRVSYLNNYNNFRSGYLKVYYCTDCRQFHGVKDKKELLFCPDCFSKSHLQSLGEKYISTY